MKLFIAPHNLGSEGAKFLAEKINAKRINPDPVESKYNNKDDHFVINWGCSKRGKWFVANKTKILNDPVHVAVGISKTDTFVKLKAAGVSIPEFTTNITEAKAWFNQPGVMVFCRTKTRGSGGEGIVIANNANEVVPAPLYTIYKKKKAEYRVAVVDGVVVDYMQKKKRTDWSVEEKGEVNIYIRSHDNGWIFARQGVVLPQAVIDNAVKSVKALSLDFGSVDIVYNESENKAYVLEINCAPGLEENGTSLERYSKAFLALSTNKQIEAAQPVPADAIINNNPAPVAPAAPVAAPVAQPVAATPVVAKPNLIVNNNVNAKNYSLDGITNVKIVINGNKTKISGKVAGLVNPIKIMEQVNGEVTFWYQDVD